jgi:hypothetical protein
MVVVALVLGFAVIMEICAMIMAPVGYQDENGFHVGTQRSKIRNVGCEKS